MPLKVVLTKTAQKDLKQLSPTLAKRILKKVEYYSSVPGQYTGAKKLVNFDGGEYRWRIGSYRVVFDVIDNSIVILRVQHRREIYK